ncbi:MAG: TCR/Tet family MFS transporter [Thermoanaerobaculia bacterium]
MDQGESGKGTGRRQAAMIFIFFTIFIDVLGIGIIIPVLPELVKQFVGGETASAGRYYGLLVASYAVMQFLCAPIVGSLSDRFGRRPVLLASLFGLGIDYVIQGVAPTIGWLFLGRLVAGMFGAAYTTGNAYIADISTPQTRARNYGLVGVAFGLAFIIGPALGGIVGSYHLRWPFFLSAGLALLNWLYGFFVLPESLPAEKRSAFTWRKSHALGSIEVLRGYPLVAGLAVAFVLISLAQRGLETSWVLYTGYRYGWDERTNGLTLGLVGLMAVIVQGLLVKPVTARIGERRAVLWGLSLGVLAFCGYGIAWKGWMIPCIIVAGSLAGIAGPAIQSMVAGTVDPTEQGKVQGALTSLISLTSIFAPLIFVAGLFSYFTSDAAPVHLPGAPFFLGALLFLAGLLWLAGVFRRIPPEEAGERTE